MKKNKLIYLLLIVFTFACSDASLHGRITRIIDGDTFIFWTGGKEIRVRMFYIDAPEKDQSEGPEASKWLSQYLNRSASLLIDGRDKYGRTLAVLYVNGRNINLQEVYEGRAHCYRHSFTDDNRIYIYAEKQAQKERAGLWAKDNQVLPVVWRHRKP